MTLHFAAPEYLWLLVLVPAAVLMGRRLAAMDMWRRITILVLRSVVLTLLVLALARPELMRESQDMTVYFVIDASDSIPSAARDQAMTQITDLLRNKPREDEVGLVVFGGDASLESLAINTFEVPEILRSEVERSRTDLSSGLRLALSAFPKDRLNRIVLLSDGNENVGSALEVSRFARNSNVPVDVLPLRYEHTNDVRVEKIVVPQNVAKDAPFDVKVFLASDQPAGGLLRLFRDDQLIAEQEIQVDAGRNPPLILSQRMQEGGFHTYRATIEVPGDTRPQNNTGEAFTYLDAEPLVLYVEGDQTTRNYLASALQIEDLRVRFVGPDQIPMTIDQIQAYDSVILSNVPASAMSSAQMRMIERAVHDLGVGLVMIGGENSFGAGGYQDSPIEEALPISMDVKQKKALPNGALVVILHTCEIPQGNTWAREIATAALDVLSEQDYFGVIYFGAPAGQAVGNTGWGGWGEYWLWEPGLQLAGNKRAMRARIRGVQPMDMPTFDPTLELAYEGLAAVRTQAKHIILISDGDPAPPSRDLGLRIREEGISISTVLIAPHSSDAEQVMFNLTTWGGGEFYFPKLASELPRIFIKEAAVVRRSLIQEGTFFPKGDAPSELLAGFGTFRSLEGYVITSDKDLATVALRTDNDDPLLAHWRYGLGKTVAFTSDAKNRWAVDWVTWDEYSKFWSQLVRWSLREASSSNLQVTTEVAGGRGRVVVDAVDIGGNFLNFLEFDARVVGPSLEPQPLRLRQVAPGRYEGDFETSDVGVYMVSMSTGEGEQQQAAFNGIALSYSPEYESTRSNDEFLARIASESGGRVVGAGYNAFSRDMPPTRRPRPLWEMLFLMGLLLVPVDIFVRRVYLSPREVAQGFLKPFVFVADRIRNRKRVVARDEAMGSLLTAKQRATAPQPEDEARDAEQQRTRTELRERLARQADTQPTGESVFDKPEGPGGAAIAGRSAKQTVAASDSPDRRPAGGSSLGGLKEAKARARKKM